MAISTRPRILIVGAGSMGLVMGYILSHTPVDVTFLVRPHRKDIMSRPQKIYCYDDNKLHTFTDYKFLTSPEDIVGGDWDYIIITLDAQQLMSEQGVKLSKTIGQAVTEKTTVIIGTVYLDIRPWFLEKSGLKGEQVIGGNISIHAYSPRMLDKPFPLSGDTDAELLEQADQAYTDVLGAGMLVTDVSKEPAERFAKLWSDSGLSKCVVISEIELASLGAPMFPVLAAFDVMGWPDIVAGGHKGEAWSLAIAAVKEIYGLSTFGAEGIEAAKAVNEKAFDERFAGIQNVMLPLDWSAFNRFHHGGKVNGADQMLRRACLAKGREEGKEMPALEKLMRMAGDLS
jgi:hypothetical protein